MPRKLRASGAKPQRRRPENFGIELQCDLLQRRKRRTRALAYALVLAAEILTPCEQQTDSKRHVSVLFAAGDTPHEVISLLLSTSDAPSEFRSSAQLHKTLQNDPEVQARDVDADSYTHLTLPTKRIV